MSGPIVAAWVALAGLAAHGTAEAATRSSGSSPSLALLAGLLLGWGGHQALSRLAKAVVESAVPLGGSEPVAARYGSCVHGMPGRSALEVAAAVAASSMLIAAGLMTGWGLLTTVGVVAVVGAVALDLWRWDRVSAGAEAVWFQRGFGQRVHRVPFREIVEVTVHEEDTGGFSTRIGRRARVCRIVLRLADKRVVALPKTDAHAHLEAVESVANQIRSRQQLMGEREAREGGVARRDAVAAPAPSSAPGIGPAPDTTPRTSSVTATEDAALRRELRRLRKAQAARAAGASREP